MSDRPELAAEYDRLADVYDAWAASDAEAEPSRRFYVQECCAEAGPVAELGVGTGRIALEVARRGKSLLGIDISAHMLAVCREQAERQGLDDRLRLRQDDARTFELEEPAALITFPFRGIAHFLTQQAQHELLVNVRRNLRPGGRFIFDHDVIQPDEAQRRSGLPQLRRSVTNADGTSWVAWNVFHFNLVAQRMSGFVIVETLDAQGDVVRRNYRPLTAAWFSSQQVPLMLARAGLAVEAAFGDFEHGPLTTSSRHQVWIARRPDG